MLQILIDPKRPGSDRGDDTDTPDEAGTGDDGGGDGGVHIPPERLGGHDGPAIADDLSFDISDSLDWPPPDDEGDSTDAGDGEA